MHDTRRFRDFRSYRNRIKPIALLKIKVVYLYASACIISVVTQELVDGRDTDIKTYFVRVSLQV